jgi:uncharacterized protein YqgC (DUF456 family)
MDILLTCLGLLCIILGLIGSFLPILPGPPISWIGLLLLYLTDAVPNNNTLLIITFIVAILVFTLDYIIPALGTKRFGGSKAGVIGTSIGLIVGLIAPIPFGIIIGPFVGALIGELTNQADTKTAIKAAFGSFLGFITSTLLKFIVACIYLGIFISVLWEHKSVIFW